MSEVYFEPMRGLTGLSARARVMPSTGERHRRLRLRTQVRLRWLAVLGQSVSVLFVWLGLGFPMPVVACLVVIACSALLNLFFELRRGQALRLTPQLALALLVFDVVQLAVLLFLTGGAENPFVMLMIGPVVISAATLPGHYTAGLAGLALVLVGVLVLVSYPLPWMAGEILVLPDVLVVGNWVAVAVTLGFAGVYVWRVAGESRDLGNALAATELALEREQHLSALDGLAAAAAHELGTPLATIALVAKEMERALPGEIDPDDVALIREQAQRCRDILRRLTSLSSEDAQLSTLGLRALLDEVASPHREFGVAVAVEARGEGREPVMQRHAGVVHGLGNLVENAVDFARSRVTLSADWSPERVTLVIADDGPGFPPELLGRIGEPYISRRGMERDGAAGREDGGGPDRATGHDRAGGADDGEGGDRRDGPEGSENPAGDDGLGQGGGLGLGLFIATTLLERSGAEVTIPEQSFAGDGTTVIVTWPRSAFEGGLRGGGRDGATTGGGGAEAGPDAAHGHAASGAAGGARSDLETRRTGP